MNRTPAEFVTFQTDQGKIMHAMGLLQIADRGYVSTENRWRDPPPFLSIFVQWVLDHNCRLMDFGTIGPILIEFPDHAVAELFKQTWHDPGEVNRIRYIDSPESNERRAKNAAVLAEWRASNSRASQEPQEPPQEP